jgi:hypothetical protein
MLIPYWICRVSISPRALADGLLLVFTACKRIDSGHGTAGEKTDDGGNQRLVLVERRL